MKFLNLLVATLLSAFTGSFARAEPNASSYLLKTQWYQDGPFARFTPDHERVGCWSTAYAQILFYHRLQPSGKVRYVCWAGYKVDVDLDAFQFDWAKFPNAIGDQTPEASLEQVAHYSFATAAVVG
jgi:hypothetical protein